MRKLLLTLCVMSLAAACSEKKVDGPTPVVDDVVKQDAADLNPRTMWQSTATPVTVTGDRFTPMASGTFLDRVMARVPKLYLVNATTSVALDNVVWLDRQTMTAEIPAGVEIADPLGWEDFAVVAVDPSGKRGEPGGSFRVSTFQTPVLKGGQIGGAKAVARYCDTATRSTAAIALTVLGDHFTDGAKIDFVLAAHATTDAAWAPATVTDVTPKQLTAVIPAGLEAGDYSLRITNIDGQIDILDGVFTVEFYTCPPASATITSVFPRFTWRGEDVILQINGTGFAPTPSVVMRRPQYSFAASYPTYFAPTTLQAFLYRDASREEGWYDLTLRNPGDTTDATFADAVLVLASPPPSIDNITPDTLPGVNKTVLITGANFPAGATVAIYNPTDGYIAAVTQAVAAGDRMYAELPGSTAPHGAYVLRVFEDRLVNGVVEKIYGQYSNIVIVGPSGNTDGFMAANSKLVTPRRDFGLAGARNGVKSRFLYAVGGRSSSSASAPGLATVEIAPIDAFGNLGAFYANTTTLGAPVYGLGLVQYEGWLYALGGSTATGVTSAVRKAKVLDPRDAPQIVSAVTSATGSLGAGTWIYQVSAIMSAGDAENPGGETLPSIEVGLGVPTGGSLQITFKAVAGADTYRIYRTATADAPGLTEQLLATRTAAQLGCATTCTFTDDGTGGSVGSTKPLKPGSLSVWTDGGALAVPRAFFAAALARNAGGTPFVYAVGGVSTATGAAAVLSSYDYAAATTAGDLSFALGANALNVARRDAGVAVATKENVDAATLGGTGADWVSLVGGTSSSTAYTGSLLDYASNAQVQSNGSLGAFSDSYSPRKTQAVAGGAAVITSNILFQMGGATNFSGATSTQQVFSGALQNNMGLGAYSNNGGAKLVCDDGVTACPRSFMGSTRFNGQVFLVGGVRDTGVVEVTDSIISVFY